MILREYQKALVGKAHEALKERNNTLVVAPTGAGKSIILSALSAEMGKKQLIIQHRDELTEQNVEKYRLVNPKASISIFNAKEKDFSGKTTFGMVQSLARGLNKFPKFDGIIVDECFVAGTIVGNQRIENISIGDCVPCFNDNKEVVSGEVVRLFKNKAPNKLVEIKANGSSIVCTENHPILTSSGWSQAHKLLEGDYIYVSMSGMWARKENKKIKAMHKLLQKKNGFTEHRNCSGKNACEKPDEEPRDKIEDVKHIKKDRTSPESEGWEWFRINRATKNSFREIKVGDGVCGSYWVASSWIRELLQDRYCGSCIKNWHRSRWAITLLSEKTRARLEKREFLNLARVDSVEVYEQSDTKKFRKLCPDGYVYNLEVKTFNTYIANGIAVHNCHHSMAKSYLNVINSAKEKNPNLWIAGFTATPSRSDGKGLREVFDNCAGQITIQQLIKMGYLVPPKTFISRIGNVPDEIMQLKIKRGEYDMDEAASVMDKPVVNEAVVKEWQRVAGYRRTIVFCTTIEHANHLTASFLEAGVSAAVVTSMTGNRDEILRAYADHKIQVIVNVAVLTEGYDNPSTSCIVLCRPCSFKSTMVQMVGRGLRPYEGKTNCYVLDFGSSLLIHKNLDMAVRYDDNFKGDAPLKRCGKCASDVPLGVLYCPICGAEFTRLTPEEITHDTRDADLIEVDLLNASPFRWEDIFGGGKVLISSGFSAWACLASTDGINWHAIAGLKGEKNHKITSGSKLICMSAADDFMRLNEDSEYARKAARWMNDVATAKQLEVLGDLGGLDFGMTKYKAACLAKFKWNQAYIERVLNV